MTWLFRHKLITLLLIFVAIYWFGNPPGRFGYVRQGLTIYNHIPVFFFDCYVAPDGSLYPESMLDNTANVNYWYEQHFTSYKNSENAVIPLIIGSGFSDTSRIAFGPKTLQACRDRRFAPHIYPSLEAIEKYNALRLEGKKVAILLKLK